MLPTYKIVDIITHKCNGKELSKDQIFQFVESVYRGTIEESQIGAFLMAVRLNGMTVEETIHLTISMAEFSDKFNWEGMPFHAQVVDKHSTGGVGDKISHILVPILVDCGLKIPMISGRGLGVTGGTIDKLDSIPGFTSNLTLDSCSKLLISGGAFIVAQTKDMVPVDKKLYAIRDISGTVESTSLVCASILSKKKIEGLQVLLLDIKYGKGTHFESRNIAESLAETMLSAGKLMGIKLICLIDDMNIPIGRCIGNAIEMAEVFQSLNDNMTADIKELVYVMAEQLLKSVYSDKSSSDIQAMITESIKSGTALQKMKDILINQGVNPNLAKRLTEQTTRNVNEYLSILGYDDGFKTMELESTKCGWIKDIDARIIGEVVRDIGAGRKKSDDILCYEVGIELLVKEFEQISKGQSWIRIRYRGDLDVSILDRLKSAIEIASESVPATKRIFKIMKNL